MKLWSWSVLVKSKLSTLCPLRDILKMRIAATAHTKLNTLCAVYPNTHTKTSGFDNQSEVDLGCIEPLRGCLRRSTFTLVWYVAMLSMY